jgi:hypothetical protein
MAVQRQQIAPERTHEQVPIQAMAGSRPMKDLPLRLTMCGAV